MKRKDRKSIRMNLVPPYRSVLLPKEKPKLTLEFGSPIGCLFWACVAVVFFAFAFVGGAVCIFKLIEWMK